MNNNIQILQLIVKYTNALYSDGSLYWSDDPASAIPERKAMVIADIKLITDNLEILNKQLV